MKILQTGGNGSASSRVSARRWTLLFLALAINCYVIFRGFGQRGTTDDVYLNGHGDLKGTHNTLNNIHTPKKSGEGLENTQGGRQTGVASNGDQTSRKEVGKDSVRAGGSAAGTSKKDVNDSNGSSGSNESNESYESKIHPEKNGERLFTTNSNSPGVPDLYGYVELYWEVMVRTRMFKTLEEASKMQEKTTVADMGMEDVVHVIGENSLPVRLRFLEELYRSTEHERRHAKVAIISTISNDVRSIERRVLPWMQYHVDMGVARFYFFYDGEDAKAVEALDSLPFVQVITAKSELGADDELRQRYEKHMGGVNKYSSSVAGVERSNEVLMSKQTFAMNEAANAASGHMDWLLHIDTDELFVPEAYISIPRAFEAMDPSEPVVRFMNLEAQVEAGDVSAPFMQVNLFRNHQYFTTKEASHFRSTFKQGLNTGWLYLYANGKSAVRVDGKPVPRALGPHYWRAGLGADPDIKRNWHNRISNSSVILHYSYMNPDELVGKAERSCPQYWGNQTVSEETLSRDCFVLPVDTRAFIAANQGPEAATKFFYENFVYSEGAPTRCSGSGLFSKSGWCSMTHIADLKEMMVRMELFRRHSLPQVTLMRHEREIQRMFEVSNIRPTNPAPIS